MLRGGPTSTAARPHWKPASEPKQLRSPPRRQPLFCRGGPVKSAPSTSLQDTAQGVGHTPGWSGVGPTTPARVGCQYSIRVIQPGRVALVVRVLTGAALPPLSIVHSPSRHPSLALRPDCAKTGSQCSFSGNGAVRLPCGDPTSTDESAYETTTWDRLWVFRQTGNLEA
jgi:hypothetical protein